MLNEIRFPSVCSVDELPDEFVPLFEWFEKFYIGKKNRRIGSI